MPHLPPIEVDGGSVTIKFPVTEGNGQRIKADGDSEIPATQDHAKIKVNRFSEFDDNAKIYLIEVQGVPGSKTHKFAPNADGICSIKIHYVSGEKAPDRKQDTEPLA